MGRPYATEMDQLADTYAFGHDVDIDALRVAVNSLRQYPLLVVGSGGSLTACHLVARLHESYARQPARVLTPLEFLEFPTPQVAAVLLLSARGRNPDILAAADHSIREEFANTIAVMTSAATPLKRVLDRAPHATSFEICGPARKDGFLATNSLLLTCCILARAYGVQLPASLPALDNPESALELAQSPSFTRSALIFLAHGWAFPAAMDFESKWSEIGFGSVSVTDSRNFAHGRHVGFAQRINETAIVSLAVRDAGATAQQTLAKLPRKAAATHLESKLSDAAGAIDLIAQAILITGAVGQRLGRDPGRPSVPAFGRALYHAKAAHRTLGRADRQGAESWWISRKVTPAVWNQASDDLRLTWRNEFHEWYCRATAQRIGGLVLDYDGTLCEAHERFSAPSPNVGAELKRLVECGMVIGIATGRGDSVVEALRTVLAEDLWNRIHVGMYNGAVLCRLDEDPPQHRQADSDLEAVYGVLKASSLINTVAVLRNRPFQLTAHPERPLPAGLLQRFILETISARGLLGTVQVCGSGHSVDIFSPLATKQNVVDRVREELRARGRESLAVVMIGDQGQFGGNDANLLSSELGLSVDRASAVLSQCWNVAPRGLRTSAATLSYLAELKCENASFTWSLSPEQQGARFGQTIAKKQTRRRPGAR